MSINAHGFGVEDEEFEGVLVTEGDEVVETSTPTVTGH